MLRLRELLERNDVNLRRLRQIVWHWQLMRRIQAELDRRERRELPTSR
jgi:hypothetical protein